MKYTEAVLEWTFLGFVVILVGLALAVPRRIEAQNCSGSRGQNAVYNPICNNQGPGVSGSSSFLDASMFATLGGNICGVLNSILSSAVVTYPANGVVVDARGLTKSTPPTSMTCAANTTPWSTDGNAHILNVPSTILLPATLGGSNPAPIVISTPWILPSNTRLIGEGDGVPSTTLGLGPGTTIQAPTGFSGAMIQFGFSAVCGTICSGISVERLTLDGQAQSANGIVNDYSQTDTYLLAAG